ncbi:MAG: hypothetical protein GF331_06290 [Chitinivibrionales bacterium]|nr:hypothetical protein [Chitinivibrionales bacterium]
MEFRWALTKSGYVGIELLLEDPLSPEGWRTVFKRNVDDGGRIAASSGPGSLRDIPFVDQSGNPLPADGLYECRFHAYEDDGVGGSCEGVQDQTLCGTTDFVHTIASLGPPQLTGIGLEHEQFNPVIPTWPVVRFNPSRSATVEFGLVPENAGGEYTAADFDGAVKAVSSNTTYERRSDGAAHSITLALEPSDAAGLAECTPYVLLARLQSTPACGAASIVEVSPRRLYKDSHAPSALAFILSNPTFDGTDVPYFNPSRPGFQRLLIQSAAPAADACAVNLTWSGEVRAPNGTRVLSLAQAAPLAVGEGVSAFWDGASGCSGPCAEGTYTLAASVYDVAGNVANSEVSFAIDRTPPEIALAVDGPEPQLRTFGAGMSALSVTPGAPLRLHYEAVDDAAGPYELLVQALWYDQAAGIVRSPETVHSLRLDQGVAEGVVEIAAGDLPRSGPWQLRVTARDRAGNRCSPKPVSLASGSAVEYLWVTAEPPLVSVYVSPDRLKSGESTSLYLSASPRDATAEPGYRYQYTVDLYYGDEASGGTLHSWTGEISASTPQPVRFEFDHNDAGPLTGRFTFVARVTDPMAPDGLTSTQTASFFVDVFPPRISAPVGDIVNSKFYVAGDVGDPTITNDDNVHGFERYEVYVRQGAVTDLPSSLAGWTASGVYVPFHNVDRSRQGLTSYPLTNIADNVEAATQSWGAGTIGYVDLSGAAPGPYTVLVVAKEKGTALEVTPATAALRSFTVAGLDGVPSLAPVVYLNNQPDGSVSVDVTAGEELTVRGRLAPGSGTASVTAYVYAADKPSDPDMPSIVARLEQLMTPAGGEYELTWDGRNRNGAYVANGDYRVAVVLQQTAGGEGNAYDHRLLSGRVVHVTTPLLFTEGSIAPTPARIYFAPASTGPPGNVATFTCKVTKPCDVYLEIRDCAEPDNLAKAMTVGPVKAYGGSAESYAVSWDARDPATDLPVSVSEAPYRLYPFAVTPGADPLVRSNRTGYAEPATGRAHFDVFVGQPPGEDPLAGEFIMSTEPYAGNSDIMFATRLNAAVWTFPEVSTQTPLWLSGTQTMWQYEAATFSGAQYRKQHKRIKFLVMVRWGIKRVRFTNALVGGQQEVSCCQPETMVDDWVYGTYVEEFTRDWPLNVVTLTATWGMDQPGTWDGIVDATDACKYECGVYYTRGGPVPCRKDGDNPQCFGECKWTPAGRYCPSKVSHPYGSKIAEAPKIMWVRVAVVEGVDTVVVDCPVGPAVSPPTGPFVPAEALVNPVFATSLVNETLTLGPWEVAVPRKAKVVGSLVIDWSKFMTPWTPLFADADNDGVGETSLSTSPGAAATAFNDETPSLQNGAWYLVNEDDCRPELQVKLTVPVGGRVEFTSPASSPAYVNEESDPQSTTFQFDADDYVGQPANTQKNILFAGKVSVNATTSSSTKAITGNPFPFNCDQGRCDDSYHWVMHGGLPKAVYGDDDGDDDPAHYTATVDFPQVVSGMLNEVNVADALSVPPPEAQVSITDVLFPYDGTTCPAEAGCQTRTTTVAKSGTPINDGPISLDWERAGSTVRVRYDKTEANATKQPTQNEQYCDPLLYQHDMLLTGCIRVDTADQEYNPRHYAVFDGFAPSVAGAVGAPPPYKPMSDYVELTETYRGLLEGSPDYSLGSIPSPLDNWLDADPTWKFVCWRDASDNLEFHPGKGISYAPVPWGWTGQNPTQVRFTYIDGSECSDIEIDGEISGTVDPRFRVGLKPLAEPKRLVPVYYRADAKPVTVTALSAFGGADGWTSVPLVKDGGVRVTVGQSVVVAFWDVSLKAGSYYLRASLEDDGGVESQRTVTLRVGPDVPESKTEPVFVSSPYRRAVLEFPAESPFSGLVSISPVDPTSRGRGDVPKGFVVDISPSELMFDQAPPRLSFFLTKKDVMAINGGTLDNLGNIGFYYLDPAHRFVRAPFAAVRYTIDPNDGSWDNPVAVAGNFALGDEQGVEFHATIVHTSLYGIMSPNTFVEIDDPVSPVSAIILTLTGSVAEADRDNVHLYVHDQPTWSSSAMVYNRANLQVSDPTPEAPHRCRWRAPAVPLPHEGPNYIFACIGEAVEGVNGPTNHVMVVRDFGAPVVEQVRVEPRYAGRHAAALVRVRVSEPAQVTVTAPGLFAGEAWGETALSDHTARISVALSGGDGQAPPEGQYRIYATARDAVGNYAPRPGMSSITIDRTAPELSHVALQALLSDNDEVLLGASGRAVDAVGLVAIHVTVSHQGVPLESWTIPVEPGYEHDFTFHGSVYVPAPIGLGVDSELGVVVTCTDLAGNQSNARCATAVRPIDDPANWAYSAPLSVSTAIGDAETYEPLSSYPLLVRLDKGNFVFSQACADGHDVRFYDLLNRELPCMTICSR